MFRPEKGNFRDGMSPYVFGDFSSYSGLRRPLNIVLSGIMVKRVPDKWVPKKIKTIWARDCPCLSWVTEQQTGPSLSIFQVGSESG